MTKQFLKDLTAMSFVAVFAALSVPVEAADVACQVPFPFTVNGKTLPQGSYNITSSKDTLLVRGFDHSAFALTNALPSSQSGEARLVFHKYGDQYILRQVWTSGTSGRQLPEPRLERSLARASGAGKDVTGLDQVVIPAL